MIDEPSQPRRRRFRLTLRTAMLAIPIFALVFLYATGINPFRRGVYSLALETQIEWCSSNLDHFMGDGHYDLSGPKPVYVTDHLDSVSVNCLLKVADVDRPKSHGMSLGCDSNLHSIAIDGRHNINHDTYGWAVQGSQVTITANELIEMRKLVAALPASQWWIPDGKTLVVGFSKGNTWETRTYDKDQLPPEVAALVTKLK